MIDASELEDSIRQRLPAHLQNVAPLICQLIINNSLGNSENVDLDARTIASIQRAISELTRQDIELRDSVISFDGSKLGDVTIRDVAGGHIFHISINMVAESHPQSSGNKEPVHRRIFTNIWYLPRRYKFWEIMNQDIGTLRIAGEEVHYEGERTNIVIKNVLGVLHTRHQGDINNNWVRVDFGDAQSPSVAYFAEANKLGMGNLFGGSEDLFNELYRFLEERKKL